MLYLNQIRVFATLIFIIAIIAGIVDAKAMEIGEGKLKFGGFVKVSTALSTKGTNGIDDALGLYNADLLFASDDKGSRFGISAKETRLHVTYTQDNTPIGPIKAYVEGNFGVDGNNDGNTLEAYGSTNNRFVLRHAYVEVGDFLIGQTFSTFLDLESAPDVIDYGGNAASVFARQPQIRFTRKMGLLTLRLAIENPTSNLGTNLITDDQRMPDFVARIDLDNDFGHLSIAGILRELRIDNGDFEAHALTGGFAVTGSTQIIKDKLSVMAQYIYGGIGHYGAFSAFADGIILQNEDGERYIDPLDFHGITGAVTIHWTDQLRSNVVASWAKNLDPGQNTQTLGTGHSIEEVKSFHANLFYQLTDDLTFGVEYKKLIGELSDNTRPNVDRYQGTVIYQF